MKPSTLYSWKECQVKFPLSYETKRLAYHCIGERDWEKKKVLQAIEHLLLSLNPFLSIHVFHPSIFFIHPTFSSTQPAHFAYYHLQRKPQNELKEEKEGRTVKPLLQSSNPTWSIYHVCSSLCRSPHQTWPQSESKGGKEGLPKTLPCSQQTLHIPCFFIRPKPPTLQYIHQHHQTWLQGEKRAEKKVLLSAKSDLASSPPE